MDRLVQISTTQARAADYLAPLRKIPARWRTTVLDGALAVLAIALGIIIGKRLAWVLVIIALVVIAALLVINRLAPPDSGAPASPPSLAPDSTPSVGIRSRGSKWSGSRTTIANQDVAIDSAGDEWRDNEIDIK